MQEVYLFIVGYWIYLLASCLLLYKIYSQRSVYGLSVDTQICFALATLARAAWTWDTRLVDTTFSTIELGCSTLISICLTALCLTYQRRQQTRQAPPALRAYTLAPVCMVVALFFHPGEQYISMQILVAFTMYLEAAAMLPQLFLMRKMHEIEPLTNTYVVLLIMSRLVRMCFWIVLFTMGDNFLQLLISDIAHFALTVDYLLLWVRKLRHAGGGIGGMLGGKNASRIL